MEATAVAFGSSCKMGSRYKLLNTHLLLSCVMDLWFPGVMAMTATARDVQQIHVSQEAFSANLGDGYVGVGYSSQGT